MKEVKRDRLTIYCDDHYHEGREVDVRTFTRLDGMWLLWGEGTEMLRGDKPPGPNVKFGHIRSRRGEYRTRHAWRCDCGANVELTSGPARTMLDQLADGGVSRISLRRLNALVSRPS